MSIIKSVQKALYENPVTIDVVTPETWRGADWSPDWFFGNAGIDYHFTGGLTNYANAYTLCSPVASIINKQAQADVNGKIWVLNTTGKAKGKESTSEFANKVRRLIGKPNPLQTRKQFEAQLKIYTKIFGWCYVMPVYPVGWEKQGLSEATSMWVIPPYMVDITESNRIFYQNSVDGMLSKVVLKYKNMRVELNQQAVNNLILFTDFVPSMDSMIFPESRILSNRMQVNNIIGAYESRNQLINYAGAQGIFSPGSDANGPIPLKPDDIKAIQQQFRQYGNKKDQWKYVFSPSLLNWQQVGKPTRDLMLFEEIVDDIQRLCDGFNHPYRLLAQESNSLGGADLKIHTRNLYADAVIPDSESMYEVWNAAFRTSENGCKIEKDFSHIDALQEDKLLNAQAQRQQNESCKLMFFNNLITYNRWLEMIGEDTITTMEINGKTEDVGSMYYFQLVALGMTFGNTNSTIQNNDNGQSNTGGEQSATGTAA